MFKDTIGQGFPSGVLIIGLHRMNRDGLTSEGDFRSASKITRFPRAAAGLKSPVEKLEDIPAQDGQCPIFS